MEAPPEHTNQPELFEHLTVDNRRRLQHILDTRVVDVHDAIRGAETQTHLESSIGRVNLNEAFSHVGELAANTALSDADQASHLADIEDHLRRAVMEHPEQVVREARRCGAALGGVFARSEVVSRVQRHAGRALPQRVGGRPTEH